MKKLIYILLLGVIFAGCTNDPEVKTPQFEAKLENPDGVIATKETNFLLNGKADLITFYSGEVLNDYNFKSGRTLEKGQVTLSFDSRVNFGIQANHLSVLASTDFDGTYQLSNVKAATWIDITNRFTLASVASSSVYLPTSADISDLVVDGKPIYIVFKYRALPQTLNGAARIWYIQKFNIKTATSIGLFELASYSTAGFQLVQEGSIIDSGRANIFTSNLQLAANNSTAGKEVETNWYVITKALDANSKDLGPDKGIAIKGYINVFSPQYTYTYSKPGTYTATFVAQNTTIYGDQKLIKTVDVIVK